MLGLDALGAVRPTVIIAGLFLFACTNGPDDAGPPDSDGSGTLSTEARAETAAEDLKRLHRQAREGDATDVARLLDRGIDPDRLHQGHTALQEAAAHGHVDVVELLLAAGADVNRAGRHDRTALHVAASCGARNVVWVLCAAGARSDRPDDFGLTPLHIAAQENLPLVLDLLLHWRGDHGQPDLNARTAWGTTPLHEAAAAGATRSVEWLLSFRYSHDLAVDARSSLGRTPLHMAALRGDAATYRRLIEAGADAAVVDDFGATPHGYLREAMERVLRPGLEQGEAPVGFDLWDGAPPLVTRYQDFPYGFDPQGLDFALWSDGFVLFSADRERPRAMARLARLEPEWVQDFLRELRGIGLLDLPSSRSSFESNHTPYAEVVVRHGAEVLRRRWCYRDPRGNLRHRLGSSMDRSLARVWDQLDLAIERLCPDTFGPAPMRVRGYDRWSSQRPRW